MPNALISDNNVRVISSHEKERARILEIAESPRVFTKEEVKCVDDLFSEYMQEGTSSSYQFLSCYSGDKLLGFCCFGKRDSTVGTYDIYWICTDSHSQRGGIGRSLMSEAEDIVSKKGGYLILVETSDKDSYLSARKFYESLRYQKVMHIVDFYSPSDGIVIYSKYLRPSDSFLPTQK